MDNAERQRRRRARLRGENVPKLKPGPKPGYKQSPEHVARRIAWGENHHAWAGDSVDDDTGRQRAQRMYRNIPPCTVCGSPKSERHHRDENTRNNKPENIAFLCRRCHMAEDGRLDALPELSRVNFRAGVDARWRNRVDTEARSGDPCPRCGGRLGVTATRASGLVYIGCRRNRGGCGFNAGSYRRP